MGVGRGVRGLLHGSFRPDGHCAADARERFAELRADTIASWENRNKADDGSLVLPQEYLVSLVRF